MTRLASSSVNSPEPIISSKSKVMPLHESRWSNSSPYVLSKSASVINLTLKARWWVKMIKQSTVICNSNQKV